MNINVKFLPKDISPTENIQNSVCIVLDIFRASNTIITALTNGCRYIKPTLEIEQALAEKAQDNSLLLAGERMSIKIEGFDFGNSPLEFTAERMANRSLIMNTSNGTKAILACREAQGIYIGGFINAQATIQQVAATANDIMIVCAGTEGVFSLEDTLCAGYLVHLLQEHTAATLTDTAYAALIMYEQAAENIVQHAARSINGARLYRLGLDADVDYCLSLNILDTVVTYDDARGIMYKL